MSDSVNYLTHDIALALKSRTFLMSLCAA